MFINYNYYCIAMSKEKFLLVSLNESKAKELAQAITNETCRKILDYLADKEATESELSEKLAVPISTVHYNLQQLQKGGLVISEEFHYSNRGKEVNHYKLANKYIIIAPKSTYGIKEKLRSILPVALITAAGAALIQIFNKSRLLSISSAPENIAAPEMLKTAADEAIMTEAASSAAPALSQNISLFSNIALWFFIGAVSALLIYLLIDWIKNK